MKENIDVIMCDNDNKVLFVYKDLTKNKIILPKKELERYLKLLVDILILRLMKG